MTMDPTRPPREPSTAKPSPTDAPTPSVGPPSVAVDVEGMAQDVLGSEIALDFEAADDAADSAVDAAVDVAPEGFAGAAIPRWTRPPLQTHRPPAEARNPSLPTFVGLIMLILTFFIVLTSISIGDRKKADAAMSSLQDAFSGNGLPMQADDGQASDAAARAFMQGLTAQIQSLVPLMGGKKASPSEHQVLWLPVSLAFAGVATDLEPTFPAVLQELLNASAKIPARFDYQVELRLCAAAPGETVRRRATALAATLARLQAPMERFVIGTQACQADRIGFAVALAPAGSASSDTVPTP